MSVDPLYFFIFAGLFSPGPNVILLTTSGARFGFRATIPHVLGVAFGVGIIAGLTGLGIGALLLALPALTFALKVLSAAWIGWMALRLWQSSGTPKIGTAEKPFTFSKAVLFQWVNPKIWVVAIAAVSYIPELTPDQQALKLASGFSGLNLFVCLFWSFAGSLLAWLLSHAEAWIIFMRVMAIALAASAAMVFF